MRQSSKQQVDFSTMHARILHFGVSFGDLNAVEKSAPDWETWSENLADFARKYEMLGNQAAEKENYVSAGFWSRKAAIYFHYAQVKLQTDEPKLQYQQNCRRNFEQFIALGQNSASKISIPFETKTIPAYLEIVDPSAPCVVLIGGLDSAKEVELYTFSREFVRRGLSVLFFDAPGQGELLGKFPLSTYFEKSIHCVVEYLSANKDFKPSALGVFGVSFGGYLACRALAVEPRLRAGISLGGFFNSEIIAKLPPPARINFNKAFCIENDDAKSFQELINLADLTPPEQSSLFIIHGENDHLVDERQLELLSNWGKIKKKIRVMENAEHVCTNRFNECLPVIGDWMAEQLYEKR
jgi:alpha/beta superfamily hydrolase